MLQRQRATSMPNKTLTGTWGIAALVLGLAGTATPALAGFEWIAPSDGGTYQAPSVNAYAAPFPSSSSVSATMAPEVISPVIITGQPDSTVPMPQAPAVAVPVPSIPAPAPTFGKNSGKTSLANATISMAPASASSESVQGFASQIPLALALRQVLPAEYNFSIDQDVDMNTLVSYKGGKPWRDTLQGMLSTAGLVSNEQGTTVTIGRANSGEPSSVISSSSAPTVSPALMENASVTSPAPALPPLAPARSVGQSSYLVPPVTTEEPIFNPVPANPGLSGGSWAAERGETLRKVLTDWCRRSGIELQWQAEYDYPIDASARFNSSFEDAVRQLLAGFDGARPQPIGELHTNPGAGQMVLVVQARGNSYTN